jgi:hypothetical protein
MYQQTETNDERTLRTSTRPQRCGTSMRQPSVPGRTVTAATVARPNTPRHIIAPATPTLGSTHFADASPTVQIR